MKLDAQEWLEGYNAGYEGRRGSSRGLSFSSGWIEGEADRKAGRPNRGAEFVSKAKGGSV